jgi:nucleobase:cation symporter-1, NCS1 family
LLPIAVVGASALGWGLVTNASASWLSWQGYLLEPFGLGGKDGAWAVANLGVLFARLLGFVVTRLFTVARVRMQESVAG